MGVKWILRWVKIASKSHYVSLIFWYILIKLVMKIFRDFYGFFMTFMK